MLRLPVLVFEEEVGYRPRFPLFVPSAFPNLHLLQQKRKQRRKTKRK